METTVFKSGGSQAVRIPKEFRFSSKRVEIERKGETIILRPLKEKDTWANGYIESIRNNPVDETFQRHSQGDHKEIEM